MKILTNCSLPFSLAHGGQAIQIERTMAALNEIGVETEPLRWWDDQQEADLLHYFGPAPINQIQLAKAKGIPLVMTSLLSATCNRSDTHLRCQGLIVRTALKLPFGEGIKQQLSWRAFSLCSHNIVGLEAERQVLEVVYGISEDRVSVVPLGLDKPFLEWGKGNHDANYLICVGTITYQKNTIKLAKLARMACVPILFVGKPYATTDPCWIEFTSLVDGQWVRHEPHVANPARMLDLLKSARGAVMMSDFENWCFAAHEAAACGLPLLVQDQKWSRERFGNQVRYFKKIGCCPENIATLKRFYEDSSRLSPPRIKFFSWHDVAIRLKGVYEKVLNEKPKG